MKGLIYSHAGLNEKPSVSTPAGGHMADDHEDSLHDGGNVGGSEKAKSSRSVDKLNAEQLARKRAADRKSQQLLRQKTRNYIESLQERVRELSGHKEELELAERRTAELEEELRNLKAILANIANSPPVNIPSIPATSPQARIDPVLHRSTPHAIKSEEVPLSQPVDYPISTPEAGIVLLPRAPNINRTNRMRQPISVSYPPPPRSSAPGIIPQQPYFVPTSFVKQPTVHAWELPLRVKEPKTPVDKILYGLIEMQKSLAAGGASKAVTIGPKYPNVNVLIAPQLTHLSHTVSRVICDLLKRLTYRTFIDKLGALLVMYPMYQWQIANDYETYSRIPSHSIPCLSQRTIPHEVWICALGSPKLRDAVIANQEKYCTEDFIHSFILNLNCNWKRSIGDAICWGRDGVTVSKDFYDHCNILDNWSLDRGFSTRYPELRDAIKFTEYSEGVGVKIEEVKEV
ncbi:hypothetical protein DL95DRAFT_354195 [Leptodontidium sp. 2 PMI_412]|nr:hypothetical protein DL95DRAFT_354195 [Leptodontidium sp. 2 PMI_412]